MTSSVYYKFKSQRDESKIAFDGTGISVFDLKREILLANNLKANDFDLLLLDPSSSQEYRDDYQIIPRSSSVVAKRVPAPKNGKSKTAMYLSGLGAPSGAADAAMKDRIMSGSLSRPLASMSKRFDGKDELAKPRSETSILAAPAAAGDDEAAAMAAMFKASTENWEQTQEKMSQAVPIYNSARGTGRGGKNFMPRPAQHHQPERPLPASYVCYRCGQKGHWIQDCPTNSDRDYDNRPRIKRTTGIPRSFLKAVDQPSEGKMAQGIMVTPEGGYVVAQPDLASWQKQVARSKAPTAAEIREKPPTDPALACPIDNKLMKNALKTPCCDTTFCEDCIVTHLVENDFSCPKCKKNVPSLEKLIVDKPMRTKVNDYIDKVMKEAAEQAEQAEEELNLPEEAEGSKQDQDSGSAVNPVEQLMKEQLGITPEMQQMFADSIPQLQAQIQQLSAMLQNPSLPPAVRQSTEFQYQQLQHQLQQAHGFAALTAEVQAVAQAAQQQAASFQMAQQQQQQQQPELQAQQWGTTPFPIQQPAGQDSAYQRLPVNARRRNMKRDRPSDFLEIGTGGEAQSKMPRFWE